MNVEKALSVLLELQPIAVNGRTITPASIEKVHMATGENQYWVRGDDSVWLSVDVDSDEVILFEDIDDELEPVDDVVPYGGEDFELSVEQSGKVLDDDDEQLDVVVFNDYESKRGQIIRLTEYEVSEDKVDVAIGQVVTEEELQKV